MPETDPYWKLKPAGPTPADEICSCSQPYPLILCHALSNNPLRCAQCNLEVPPERLQLDLALVDELASWREFYGCFYKLWLDSGEFESWARAQLGDPSSPANQRGYQLCARLSTFRPCYYWWFQDTGVDDFEPVKCCPRCNANLTESFGRLACERCSIIVPN
jgi:predicted  nucleic acid-binding Zn ribbon protein